MGDTTLRHRRILAISSGGGHWVQLLRMAPGYDEHDVHFATVDDSYREDVHPSPFHRVPDATRWNKLALVRLGLSVAWLLVRVRPDVVITTGAAPGWVAVRLARLARSQTIWVDSIANADRLSMSGRMIGPHAGVWLTQWPHLATPDGPEYAGAVL